MVCVPAYLNLLVIPEQTIDLVLFRLILLLSPTLISCVYYRWQVEEKWKNSPPGQVPKWQREEKWKNNL